MKKGKTSTLGIFIIMIILFSPILCDITGQNNSPIVVETYALPSPINENALERYNATLWVRDWANKTSCGNVNVTIFDPQKKRSSSYISNQKGQINLTLIEAGSYVISVQKANRTVGYQEINITQNATLLIKTWAYDFSMTLVDSQGNRLANHTIMLYDQMNFGMPRYTYESDTVVRHQNITLVTEGLGNLVGQAKTNNNGTLSFLAVWNGTYVLKVVGVETVIKEYVLGELKVTHIPSATGEVVMALQNPANVSLPCIRADFQLHLVSASNANITRAQVYTRDMNGYLFYEDISNATGYVEHKNVYFINGTFAITARYGKRTIGYSEIKVTETKVFTIKCWTNNLTVTCVDLDGAPLDGYIVFLYDQLVFHSPTNITVVTNQTGQLINWTKTDENGIARFRDLWNGTYWITVSSGEIVKQMILDLQKTVSVKIIGEIASMSLVFVTRTGQPLSGAIVRAYDGSGNLIFREYTDASGHILRRDLHLDSYMVNVEWMGTQVASETVNTRSDYGKTITCAVYSLTVRSVDQFGNVLPKADVVIETVSVALQAGNPRIRADTDTDETGSLTLLLPQGFYTVSVDSGIFSGSQNVNLGSSQSYTVICNIKLIVWISLVLLILPFTSFTIILERRKLRKPLEIRRYKSMLSKLETMYNNGRVEYKIYRKLREEYDARIMELGGREMR